MIDRLRRGHYLMVDLCSYLQAPLLLAIRLFWGFYYVKSGVVKLGNIDGLLEYFIKLGIPCPGISCYLASLAHLVCGICMIIGLASRLTAIPLAFTMIVAYATAHSGVIVNALNSPAGVVQALPFLFLLANLIVIAFGAGTYSVDAYLERRWPREQ